MPPQRPRRRLTDLCLIALFKQLEPKDQVKASRMNSRCLILVRAANRRVRTLVITDWDNYEVAKFHIDSYSLASKPSMKQLPGAEPLDGDYPMNAHLSKWNFLDIRDLSITTEVLVTIFSAVTDLKFFLKDFHFKEQYLVDLLRHPNWADQLTNFMLVTYPSITEEVFDRFCTAINDLSALKYLAIDFGRDIPMPDLLILAQLKVIVMGVYKNQMKPILRSLKRHTTENARLQVHLLPRWDITKDLQSLRGPVCSFILIAHICEFPLSYTSANGPLQFGHLTSLTSFSVGNIYALYVGPLFTFLTPFSQLVHLELKIIFDEKEQPWSSRPQAQLKSVRALDLDLTITSHSQLQWLNFQWTLPHLQAIHLKNFHCESCKVNLDNFREGVNSPTREKARECLNASLLPHLHLEVPQERIIFQTDNLEPFSPFLSFNQL